MGKEKVIKGMKNTQRKRGRNGELMHSEKERQKEKEKGMERGHVIFVGE